MTGRERLRAIVDATQILEVALKQSGDGAIVVRAQDVDHETIVAATDLPGAHVQVVLGDAPQGGIVACELVQVPLSPMTRLSLIARVRPATPAERVTHEEQRRRRLVSATPTTCWSCGRDNTLVHSDGCDGCAHLRAAETLAC